MNRKVICAALFLGLFVQAEGTCLAGTILSDTLFFAGAVFPLPEDVPGVPQVVVIPNAYILNNVPSAVQLYEDSRLTVLSDQLYTVPNANGGLDLHFESDPDLTTLNPNGFDGFLKVAETGGVQDFSNFFNFQVAVQSDVENVPEPATLTLLGIGALGMAGYGWRKRKTA